MEKQRRWRGPDCHMELPRKGPQQQPELHRVTWAKKIKIKENVYLQCVLPDYGPTLSPDSGISAAGRKRKPTTTKPWTRERQLKDQPSQVCVLDLLQGALKRRNLALQPHGLVAGYTSWLQGTTPETPQPHDSRALWYPCTPADPHLFWSMKTDFYLVFFFFHSCMWSTPINPN